MISNIVKSDDEGSTKTFWQVYYIDNAEDVGDLTGAIHGFHYQGFIGELYRQFPFPKRAEAFKQKPEGVENRYIVEEMIAKYARRIAIQFFVHEGAREVEIGAYRFSRTSFQELIKYVWRGGYPRWRDNIRPDHVLAMKKEIEWNKNRLFEGISFED